jgi:hypothetical protein
MDTLAAVAQTDAAGAALHAPAAAAGAGRRPRRRGGTVASAVIAAKPGRGRASLVEASYARKRLRIAFHPSPDKCGRRAPDSNRNRLPSVERFSAAHPASGFQPSATTSTVELRRSTATEEGQVGTDLARFGAVRKEDALTAGSRTTVFRSPAEPRELSKVAGVFPWV